MDVICRSVFISQREGRCVMPGFVSYLSDTEPVLLHRYGWIDASDTYDDFADIISRDNGRTWSKPVMRQRSWPVEGGRMRYAEHGAYFDPVVGRLLVTTKQGLYPHDHHSRDIHWQTVFNTYNPDTDSWSEPIVTDFGFAQGAAISFSFPIKTTSNEILIPAQKPMADDLGRRVYLPGHDKHLNEAYVIIGRWTNDGQWHGEPSERVQIDPRLSSRGLMEPTIAQLKDGRIAMVCRGSNDAFPDRPGYKWVSFSQDGGRRWSAPEPLMTSEGDTPESGSNGSALIRSIHTGKLYWMGNLALDGVRAHANWPRSPLVIVEMQESPFRLKLPTLKIIDHRREGDSERLQLSNFRYYQDRQTGDLCVFLSRLGERDPDQWKTADYYMYRIALD